ncbi:uncharacterized protein TNCV_447901 [Trichonephila clavipes]|nr:uncharacterized protein TNCV_447901 [Trichonephila clavipes]
MKEIILDVRFPKQKNQRVIFQCGERAWLTSDHVVLFTATLPPQIRPKIERKNCMKNIRVIRPLVKAVTPKFLGDPPVDRDRLNAYLGLNQFTTNYKITSSKSVNQNC